MPRQVVRLRRLDAAERSYYHSVDPVRMKAATAAPAPRWQKPLLLLPIASAGQSAYSTKFKPNLNPTTKFAPRHRLPAMSIVHDAELLQYRVEQAPDEKANMSLEQDADTLVRSSDPLHPANHISDLCRKFYTLGWVTGTGGGVSIRHGDHIYLAPSGVQKEMMQPTDMFVMDFRTREYLRRPKVGASCASHNDGWPYMWRRSSRR